MICTESCLWSTEPVRGRLPALASPPANLISPLPSQNPDSRGSFAPLSSAGWDVFTLRYDVHEPLATLFNPPAMASYLRVFRLLWGLKRVEHGLSGAWQMLNAMQRQLSMLGILFRRYSVLCDGRV